MDNYFEQSISPIELLGYAKNNIVDVQEQQNLPYQVKNYLFAAYQLLTLAQEYLYSQ